MDTWNFAQNMEMPTFRQNMEMPTFRQNMALNLHRRTGDTPYLKKSIGRLVTECLAEVVQIRPADPIDYIAKWLYHYANTRIYYQEKERLANEMEIVAEQERKEFVDRQTRMKIMKATRRACQQIMNEPEKLRRYSQAVNEYTTHKKRPSDNISFEIYRDMQQHSPMDPDAYQRSTFQSYETEKEESKRMSMQSKDSSKGYRGSSQDQTQAQAFKIQHRSIDSQDGSQKKTSTRYPVTEIPNATWEMRETMAVLANYGQIGDLTTTSDSDKDFLNPVHRFRDTPSKTEWKGIKMGIRISHALKDARKIAGKIRAPQPTQGTFGKAPVEPEKKKKSSVASSKSSRKSSKGAYKLSQSSDESIVKYSSDDDTTTVASSEKSHVCKTTMKVVDNNMLTADPRMHQRSKQSKPVTKGFGKPEAKRISLEDEEDDDTVSLSQTPSWFKDATKPKRKPSEVSDGRTAATATTISSPALSSDTAPSDSGDDLDTTSGATSQGPKGRKRQRHDDMADMRRRVKAAALKKKAKGKRERSELDVSDQGSSTLVLSQVPSEEFIIDTGVEDDDEDGGVDDVGRSDIKRRINKATADSKRKHKSKKEKRVAADVVETESATRIPSDVPSEDIIDIMDTGDEEEDNTEYDPQVKSQMRDQGREEEKPKKTALGKTMNFKAIFSSKAQAISTEARIAKSVRERPSEEDFVYLRKGKSKKRSNTDLSQKRKSRSSNEARSAPKEVPSYGIVYSSDDDHALSSSKSGSETSVTNTDAKITSEDKKQQQSTLRKTFVRKVRKRMVSDEPESDIESVEDVPEKCTAITGFIPQKRATKVDSSEKVSELEEKPRRKSLKQGESEVNLRAKRGSLKTSRRSLSAPPDVYDETQDMGAVREEIRALVDGATGKQDRKKLKHKGKLVKKKGKKKGGAGGLAGHDSSPEEVDFISPDSSESDSVTPDLEEDSTTDLKNKKQSKGSSRRAGRYNHKKSIAYPLPSKQKRRLRSGSKQEDSELGDEDDKSDEDADDQGMRKSRPKTPNRRQGSNTRKQDEKDAAPTESVDTESSSSSTLEEEDDSDLGNTESEMSMKKQGSMAKVVDSQGMLLEEENEDETTVSMSGSKSNIATRERRGSQRSGKKRAGERKVQLAQEDVKFDDDVIEPGSEPEPSMKRRGTRAAFFEARKSIYVPTTDEPELEEEKRSQDSGVRSSKRQTYRKISRAGAGAGAGAGTGSGAGAVVGAGAGPGSSAKSSGQNTPDLSEDEGHTKTGTVKTRRQSVVKLSQDSVKPSELLEMSEDESSEPVSPARLDRSGSDNEDVKKSPSTSQRRGKRRKSDSSKTSLRRRKGSDRSLENLKEMFKESKIGFDLSSEPFLEGEETFVRRKSVIRSKLFPERDDDDESSDEDSDVDIHESAANLDQLGPVELMRKESRRKERKRVDSMTTVDTLDKRLSVQQVSLKKTRSKSRASEILQKGKQLTNVLRAFVNMGAAKRFSQQNRVPIEIGTWSMENRRLVVNHPKLGKLGELQRVRMEATAAEWEEKKHICQMLYDHEIYTNCDMSKSSKKGSSSRHLSVNRVRRESSADTASLKSGDRRVSKSKKNANKKKSSQSLNHKDD